MNAQFDRAPSANSARDGSSRSIQAQYDCIRVLSETEFYDDLKFIDVPVLAMHGEDV
jgi:non-heme chloroperoxidase